jgi:hypothetical protein
MVSASQLKEIRENFLWFGTIFAWGVFLFSLYSTEFVEKTGGGPKIVSHPILNWPVY